MLEELKIENLAVIPGAEITFAPGLNVISGETGAGKTILAQAMALLLGMRADSNLIRPDAESASVEAFFDYSPGCYADLDDVELDEEEGLAVRRRLAREGQSRAYVGGRVASLAVLGQLTGRLMAFSAQHEQRKLMMASRQLELLDSFCGERMLVLRDEYQALFDRRQQIKSELENLSTESDARRREAELLRFQKDEIEAAGLEPGEEDELMRRRSSLQRASELLEVSTRAEALLSSSSEADGQQADIMALLSTLKAQLEDLKGVEDKLDAIAERLDEAYFELEDLGGSFRDFRDSLETDPELLSQVEERLDLLASLKRKYGSSVDEVIAYAEEGSDRLERLESSEADRTALDAALGETEADLEELAESMHEIRQAASTDLSLEVERHLADLAFGDCGFEARLTRREAAGEGPAATLDRSGCDEMDFYVRLNPGMPATPLRETASGGELSRIMLAVKCAVEDAGETVTLVFDEIDAGIGGETGSAVGAKLKRLSQGAQIICITHLPQIACYADAHFSVIKQVDGKADETVTRVSLLAGDEVVDELCRMMGSRPADERARAHAESLLDKAATA